MPGISSLQVTVTSSQAWLVHPGVPSLSQPIVLRPGTLQDQTYTVTRGVFRPLGRENAVVFTGGTRSGAASQLILFVETVAARTALRNLIRDASTLLLNPPDASWEFGPAYIAIGDVKFSRMTDVVIDSLRDVVLPFDVVDRPAGGVQSSRTWSDILANFGSWSAVLANYKSWNDVLTGP
jgi:hypothetical protein